MVSLYANFPHFHSLSWFPPVFMFVRAIFIFTFLEAMLPFANKFCNKRKEFYHCRKHWTIFCIANWSLVMRHHYMNGRSFKEKCDVRSSFYIFSLIHCFSHKILKLFGHCGRKSVPGAIQCCAPHRPLNFRPVHFQRFLPKHAQHTSEMLQHQWKEQLPP